jgi:zinc transport system ATP-binding protein
LQNAADAQLLVLDEPTVGIDATSQEEFYALLSELNKKHNITIILVSHDIDVITNEVSIIACINKTLVYHGEPKKFVKKDMMEQLYGKGRKFVDHNHTH